MPEPLKYPLPPIFPSDRDRLREVDMVPYTPLGYQAQFLRNPKVWEEVERRIGKEAAEELREMDIEQILDLSISLDMRDNHGNEYEGLMGVQNPHDVPITYRNVWLPEHQKVTLQPGGIGLFGAGGHTPRTLTHEYGHAKGERDEGAQQAMDFHQDYISRMLRGR